MYNTQLNLRIFFFLVYYLNNTHHNFGRFTKPLVICEFFVVTDPSLIDQIVYLLCTFFILSTIVNGR